jgi:hypothetical protein
VADTINARIPPGVQQKLAEYCVKQGVTRTEVVVKALDQFLDNAGEGASAYTLAIDLIPKRGIPRLQARNARALARKAFRGSRSR